MMEASAQRRFRFLFVFVFKLMGYIKNTGHWTWVVFEVSQSAKNVFYL